MDPNLRNLKDFLTLYNKVTELCFNRCVDNFNERQLDANENVCTTNCVNKYVAFNHKMMGVYVEIQTNLNNKRLKELEEEQKANNTKQSKEPLTTNIPNSNLMI